MNQVIIVVYCKYLLSSQIQDWQGIQTQDSVQGLGRIGMERLYCIHWYTAPEKRKRVVVKY